MHYYNAHFGFVLFVLKPQPVFFIVKVDTLTFRPRVHLNITSRTQRVRPQHTACWPVPGQMMTTLHLCCTYRCKMLMGWRVALLKFVFTVIVNHQLAGAFVHYDSWICYSCRTQRQSLACCVPRGWSYSSGLTGSLTHLNWVVVE